MRGMADFLVKKQRPPRNLTRVLSTGGGRAEAFAQKCQSSPPPHTISISPPKHFHKIWQNTIVSNTHTLAINFLSAINKVQSSKCVIGRVLIEVASAINFFTILFHSLAIFTINQCKETEVGTLNLLGHRQVSYVATCCHSHC